MLHANNAPTVKGRSQIYGSFYGRADAGAYCGWGIVMKKLALSAVLAGTAFTLAAPAVAAPSLGSSVSGGGGCSTDLAFTGTSSLGDCYGRYDYNVLTNTNIVELNFALDQLGYAGPDVLFANFDATKLNFIDTAGAPINFPGIFNGTLFFGLKTGNGGLTGVGNGTTFYRINAVNLDVFNFLPTGASSGGFVIVPPAIPEPGTWAMLIAGFGLMGGAVRAASKRRQMQFA